VNGKGFLVIALAGLAIAALNARGTHHPDLSLTVYPRVRLRDTLSPNCVRQRPEPMRVQLHERTVPRSMNVQTLTAAKFCVVVEAGATSSTRGPLAPRQHPKSTRAPAIGQRNRHPRFSMSSCCRVVVGPGGGLVVEGAGLQAAVQDADEPVGELA
jgi:hypothetical protein